MRRTGWGRKDSSIYLVEDWDCVLYSTDTWEPLQSVTQTPVTTAAAAGFCSLVLFGPNYRQQNRASVVNLQNLCFRSLTISSFSNIENNVFFFFFPFLPDYCFKNNSAATGFINMHTVQCKWLLRPPLGRWFNVAVMKAAQTVLD